MPNDLIISSEHNSFIIEDLVQFIALKEKKLYLVDSFIDSEQKALLSYFIGIEWLQENEKALYVEPKLNNESRQTNYLQMLFSALKHPDIAKHTNELFEIKFNQPYIEIEQQQDLLTPLLVVQFLRIVKEIVRKGLKKSYYKIEQDLYGRVKGKVLVGQTIKQNLLKNKPLYTYCSYDEFGWNGLENRLLKKALIFVQRYLPILKNLRADKYTIDVFNYIMPAFESVSEEVNLTDIKHTKTNIFYKEYGEGIRLARLVLKRFGYNINTTQEKGKIKTPPFWIDMSKLFELYVLGLLKEVFGRDIIFQFQANYGQLDYLLTKQKIIVDAKYKTYYDEDFKGQAQWKRDKIASDIRQLSGYGRDTRVLSKLGVSEKEQMTYVPECLIIYPDQNCENKDLKNIDLTETPISQFVHFYKLPVLLPVII